MKKSYLFLTFTFVIFLLCCFSFFVSAEERHNKKAHEEYDHFKPFEKYDNEYNYDDDSDVDEEDYYKYINERYWNQGPNQSVSIKEVWYKWSKSANVPSEIEPFPLLDTSVLSLVVEQQTAQMDFIAQGSQVMVPIEEATKVMGGKVTVYPHSEIIEINKGIRQLIVRNNSRVVYENMKKVPMQEKVIQRNGKYYMPLSVLANGLGFEIHNQVENNQIRLERMVRQ